MKEDSTRIALSVLVATEGAHAFSAFMPSAFTIRKFAIDSEDRSSLRAGYTPAIAFNVILGGAVSVLIDDALPIILAAVVSAGMVALYESQIRKAGL